MAKKDLISIPHNIKLLLPCLGQKNDQFVYHDISNVTDLNRNHPSVFYRTWLIYFLIGGLAEKYHLVHLLDFFKLRLLIYT